MLRGGEPRRLPGFDEGRWTVQDQASAFVVRGAGPRNAATASYDACAAPGGKALHAAELVGPEGRVLAADRSESRVGLIAAAAGAAPARTRGSSCTTRRRRRSLGPFDRVLVDAPCSGVGSARRRPELLWRVPKHRLSGLAALQLAIVGSAADAVRPGGRLVYAVCTFTRAETDAVCDALLRRRPDLDPIETDGPDGRTARHRLWPHRHGCDAMFVAAFRRAS